jgi:molybdopterin-guanine dinucleotide biosynthesis protein A
MVAYDGVVLAGGSGSRMGTRHKPALLVGGRPMIAAALDALAGAGQVLVSAPDGNVCEDPPGGGPVAGLAAAMDRVSAPVVVVLAADLPFVTAACVERLVANAPAVASDRAGQPQFLLGAYLTGELRAAIPQDAAGASMRRVCAALATPPALIDLSPHGSPAPWWDCDTPAQLEAARRWA